MTTQIQPLSITILPRANGGRYKSISNLVWNDIPSFAVLTGKNGSGKTQLLEVLAYHYSGAIPQPPNPTTQALVVQTTGATYQPAEIGYVPSGGRFSGAGGTSIASLPGVRGQALAYASNAHQHRHDINMTV